MQKLIYSLLFILTSIGLINCKEEVKTEKTEVGAPSTHLVTATPQGEATMNEMQEAAKLFGQSAYISKILYGVSTYKVIYKTTYRDSTIHASGMLYVPKGMKEGAPLLSLQHGTTFEKADAPSISPSMGMEFFASGGYIAFMPDFIGYGSSSALFHPYYDQKHSALAVIDMIKAGKEFLTKQKVAFNDQLFLAGYSEGGYVTLATAKELETNPVHDMKVTAVAAGAGGYDLTQMLSTVNTNKNYSYPAYLAFVIGSYKNTYKWNKPYSYFFNEKYASKLPALLDGTKSGGYINSNLTTNLEELFNPTFFASLKGGGELELKSALVKNSLTDWTPSFPVKLYHGTSDEIVPYVNSELTYNSLKDKGAKNIELVKISGGTHGSSLVPMIKSLVPWFESLRPVNN